MRSMAYYVGEAGRWTLDLNADYLDNRMKSSQYAEDGSGADISSVSDSESRLYAARLQAGVKLGKGQLSFGSEGTLTERKDLFTQSGLLGRCGQFHPPACLCGLCRVFGFLGKMAGECGAAL